MLCRMAPMPARYCAEKFLVHRRSFFDVAVRFQPLVCISTYSMVAYAGKRTYAAEEAMKFIESQEWGLLLLDGMVSFWFNY